MRQERGLDQGELARLAGVSRQTVSSIESGRSDPATGIALALARVLRVPVEELFGQEPATLDAEVAPPRGSRRVALGEIDGRWIAHPVQPFAPADGLLAPRDKSQKRARVQPLRPAEDLRRGLIALGCDPALGLLAAHLGDACRLTWVPASSTAALEALAGGRAHLAGAHLRDEQSGEFNLPFVQRLLPGREVLLVNLARWREGLLVRRGNPRGVRGAHDLSRRPVRIVNREPGSGARRVLDKLLADARVSAKRVQGYDRVVGTHAAVAQAVAMGAADAGVASESAAIAYGLHFVPLAEERSDVVIPSALAREPRGARLLEALQGRAFRRDLSGIDAYETAQSGRVLAEVRP